MERKRSQRCCCSARLRWVCYTNRCNGEIAANADGHDLVCNRDWAEKLQRRNIHRWFDRQVDCIITGLNKRYVNDISLQLHSSLIGIAWQSSSRSVTFLLSSFSCIRSSTYSAESCRAENKKHWTGSQRCGAELWDQVAGNWHRIWGRDQANISRIKLPNLIYGSYGLKP